MKKYTLGVIGTGFMAKAILHGMLQNKLLSANEIIVYDSLQNAMLPLQKEGIILAKNNLEVANSAEYLLLAVKPQNCLDVLQEIQNCTCKQIISIMAGVTMHKIKNAFSLTKNIARAMPNLPAAVGCAMTAIDLHQFTGYAKEFIYNIFQAIGKVIEIDESKLDAVTGISGSGPAYIFLFLQGMIEAGQIEGLSFEESKILALQTIFGASKMIEATTDKSIQELINAVCSKGGTTIQAIESFQRTHFKESIREAVSACVKRAKELSE